MRTIPISIDGEKVLVEIETRTGFEKTAARTGEASDDTSDSFERAMRVLKAISRKVVTTAKELNQATRPEELSLEIGLSFEVSGSVIITSSKAGGTLVVKMLFRPKLNDVTSDNLP